ncbi:hypothetical protein VOLCADRAFT_97998 [Volvox carteri f. nagariensis]|uniref:PLAT domain-containing protein n=1 Tax=Volvox carteri f. nagariensis TaxID=3068 RepID=D8UE67_VOLCA|nr:uncharacterized protein VOLCADRAFT_97998 [Volvox carteri f. nagariensis]EFJ41913.1 hypothetical protein VOLCADRAFT_97998 [Volvox carteri f. nagariensis]|eukprot:XP_002956950.1 hypothetical protein VOLCADRAFT_97998 [Volvox carteri f. nagariensis]
MSMSTNFRSAWARLGCWRAAGAVARPFERSFGAEVSTFVFTAVDVGEVERLRLRLRNQASGGTTPSWHLEAVQVASSASGTRYHFPHSGWVDNVLGRECVLYCKGTAPDADEDPSVPSSASLTTGAHADTDDIPHEALPPPPPPPPPSNFVRGMVKDDAAAAAAAAVARGDGGRRRRGDDEGKGWTAVGGSSVGDDTLQQLEDRFKELSRRLAQVEEAQAESALRAAAATAAAVLVHVPSPLLAPVRYGRKGSGGAAAEAQHNRSSGLGAAAGGGGAGGTGEAEEDSALMLLADLLTHLHSMAEKCLATAAAADAQAATAADATRRQQSRIAQLQFEMSATSQVAEQAARRCEQISQELEAAVAAAAPPLLPQEAMSTLARLAEPGGRGSEVQYGKVRLRTLVMDVKRLAAEMGGSGAAAAAAAAAAATAASQVETLLAETRSSQARLAASLAEVAASLASQRNEQEEQLSDGFILDAFQNTDIVSDAGTVNEASALQVAISALKHELLLRLTWMAENSTGRAAGERRNGSRQSHGGVGGSGDGGGGGGGPSRATERPGATHGEGVGSRASDEAGDAVPNDDDGDDDSLPSRGSEPSG